MRFMLARPCLLSRFEYEYEKPHLVMNPALSEKPMLLCEVNCPRICSHGGRVFVRGDHAKALDSRRDGTL